MPPNNDTKSLRNHALMQQDREGREREPILTAELIKGEWWSLPNWARNAASTIRQLAEALEPLCRFHLAECKLNSLARPRKHCTCGLYARRELLRRYKDGE